MNCPHSRKADPSTSRARNGAIHSSIRLPGVLEQSSPSRGVLHDIHNAHSIASQLVASNVGVQPLFCLLRRAGTTGAKYMPHDVLLLLSNFPLRSDARGGAISVAAGDGRSLGLAAVFSIKLVASHTALTGRQTIGPSMVFVLFLQQCSRAVIRRHGLWILPTMSSYRQARPVYACCKWVSPVFVRQSTGTRATWTRPARCHPVRCHSNDRNEHRCKLRRSW